MGELGNLAIFFQLKKLWITIIVYWVVRVRRGTCVMHFRRWIQLTHSSLVSVVEPVEPIIYFGTQYGGLQSYSSATLEVKNITNSTEWVSGVTYDSIQDKIYWAGYSRIWRGNRDGSQVEMVVSMRHCMLHFRFRSYEAVVRKSLENVA